MSTLTRIVSRSNSVPVPVKKLSATAMARETELVGGGAVVTDVDDRFGGPSRS